MSKQFKIVQQESGNQGVQQHAAKTDAEKTFCGVNWITRIGWYVIENDLTVEEARKWPSCLRCQKGLDKHL